MSLQAASESKNIDLQFLRQYANTNMQTAALRSNKLSNLLNFTQLLKSKNSKFNFSQQNKQSGQQWIRKKGANLNPFLQKIKAMKQQAKVEQQQMKSQTLCHFYQPNVNIGNQQAYIEKNFQFGIVNTIQSIYMEGKNRGNLAKRILNRRLINRQVNKQENLDGLPMIMLQVRSPKKKQQYINVTKRIKQMSLPNKGNQWATLYHQATRKLFWQILLTQFSNLQKYKQKDYLQILTLQSLKIVQNELDKALPPNYQNILRYLTNNYLGKIKGQFNIEGSMGPVWGISLMLYRAGRKNQFYANLKDYQQLRRLFKQADNSIAQSKPKKFGGVQQGTDLFYNQLVYALKGLPKCSCLGLSDPNTIDIAWIFLRNVGIFPQEHQTFYELRKKYYQRFNGPGITQTKIKNLLYLLGYGQIAEIGTNDLMDQDDYLHFLIVIYHSPIYNVILRDKKSIVEKRLTQQLVHYIQELIIENKKDYYIYYMLLIPNARMVQQISSIVASSSIIWDLNWDYLSKNLKPSLFEKVIYASLQKHASLHQEYVKIATKSYQLLKDNRISLKFVLNMFIKSALTTRLNSQEIREGELFANQILNQDSEIKLQYGSVFKFFEQLHRLQNLIELRDQKQLLNFIKESNFILVSEIIRLDTRNTLQKLIQHRGFQCYIVFIRSLVKAYQITFTRLNYLNHLQQFQNLTLNCLLGLIRTEPYTEFINKQSVKDLVRMLQEALSSYS